MVDLGPSNRSALMRMANYTQDLINKGGPLPPSPFARYVAERITGEDKLDFSMILSGKKGSGKSYSSLYICRRISEEIAKIRGGTPEDYFSLKNCALLLDTDGIGKILDMSEKYQCILIDDSQAAVGSREFATNQNRNFNKIFSTCRTNRWFLLLNTPVRTHIDLQLREMVDVVGTVFKPFHKGRFNVLKIHSIELSEYRKNQQYRRRMSFNDRKIDYWIAGAPPADMAAEYDKLREEGAKRIISKQQDPPGRKGSGPTLAERNLIKLVDRYGPIIKAEVQSTPGITVSKLADRIGLNRHNVRRICAYGHIPVKGVD